MYPLPHRVFRESSKGCAVSLCLLLPVPLIQLWTAWTQGLRPLQTHLQPVDVVIIENEPVPPHPQQPQHSTPQRLLHHAPVCALVGRLEGHKHLRQARLQLGTVPALHWQQWRRSGSNFESSHCESSHCKIVNEQKCKSGGAGASDQQLQRSEQEFNPSVDLEPP